MGYSTRYKLKVVVGEKEYTDEEKTSIAELEKFIEATNDVVVKTTLQNSLKQIKNAGVKPITAVTEVVSYNPFDDECKWYDHEEHMVKVSLKYPHILWIVSGEGEESGDVWIKYFKNGKFYRAEPVVTWPEFDESHLK